MQNVNEFPQIRKSTAYPQLDDTVDLNDPYCVDIALKFIKTNFSTDFSQIKLIATVHAGYNDYMLLDIPADTDFKNLDYTKNFDINDADSCTKINDTVYAFYVYYPELAEFAETPY